MSMEELLGSLSKTLGENAPVQSVTKFIDTGYPPLNKVISGRFDGGLPYGRIVECYGPSSSGKSALATEWMVQAQKLGGVAIFIDWERSFDVGLAKGFGLNDERPYWLYFKPETWEKGNILAANACKIIRESDIIDPEAPILVVFDSVASAIPNSMIGKQIDEYTMNDTTALARVASTTLKTMAHHAEHFNATFLYLNQTRMRPGTIYGDPITTTGGSAMEFYATTRMALSRKKITENKDGGKTFVGQTITVKCVKSKLTKPFQECTLDMVYDDLGVARFDSVGSTVQYMCDVGLLEKSGPRVTWTDGKKYFVKELVKKVYDEGGLDVLKPMLPKPVTINS